MSMKKVIRLIIIAGLLAMSASVYASDKMAADFAKPPQEAKPWVLWFPINGNLTKEGITADLEAMARVGLGGLLCMEVNQGAPEGSVSFAGPLWRELFQHTCREAKRLGLQINMNNDAGWCGSGGPWITPELSMQKVVWSETRVEGGKLFESVLAQPKAVENFYRDIAVMAMPVPEAEQIEFSRPYRLDMYEGKSSVTRAHVSAAPAQYPTLPAGNLVRRDQVIDLTSQMDAAGKLTWQAPPGRWVILRFGHTSTGVNNRPAPEAGRGLECDKLSKEAATAHYHGLISKLMADNKALAGQGNVLVATHIDSWEVGSQNWTPKMREEFKRRRGYDLLPLLPIFTGRVLDSVEFSERFLWDLRLRWTPKLGPAVKL